jgi:hypothetical protein
LDFRPEPTELFSDVTFTLTLHARNTCNVLDLCLLFYTEHGQRAAIVDLRNKSQSYEVPRAQSLKLSGTLSHVSLVPGKYEVGLFIRTSTHMQDYLGLKTLEVRPQPGRALLSYAPEHLGLAALDANFTAATVD